MDEVDKKIISQLQADGRTSLEELAKITGFTSMGTKKRLEKLIEQGTIKISALINPAQLGLHPAIVMLEMESAEAMQNVIEPFQRVPPSSSDLQNNRRLQPNGTCRCRKPRNS